MIKYISSISDQELLNKLSGLVKIENETTIEILLYLAELEERKLYLSLGYSSLFDYCQRKLGYSEPAAVRRIKAARCIKDFPEVKDFLLKREVSLSTVCLFAPLLNSENKAAVFKGVRGKSKTEVERFLANARPRAKNPVEKIRPLAVQKKPVAEPQTLQLFDLITKNTPAQEAKEKESKQPSAAPKAAAPVEERFELRFSVDQETLDKLNRAKVLIGQGQGQVPSLEDVFKAALGEYLKTKDPVERQKRREVKVAKVEPELPSPAANVTYQVM